jgi:hypothetical protein
MLLIITLPTTSVYSQQQENRDKDTLHPKKLEKAPVIDGRLDEDVWKFEPTIDKDFIVIDPTYGDILPQKTRVWMAYDSENLYFAFHCMDPEPDKIKTAIQRRDFIWGDDCVGIVIDTAGSRQNGYQFICNASGIQLDLYRTATSEDPYTDWVWYSAAQRVDDGFTVEMHIPLKSIRYSSGSNVRMGIAVYRKVSRTGFLAFWPDIPLVDVVYEDLSSQNKLEILPSVTYGSIWDRESPDKWSNADDKIDFGVSLKYGVTSTITAEATINPDFSQVESDAFQVLVNQRYPIFYQEKRPFFMEATNSFTLGSSGPGMYMLWSPVHTRKIIDPLWGVKLTGEMGLGTIGLLAAGDEWPGRDFGDDAINPLKGENANFWIGRFKYALGGENYLGLIFTSHSLADQYNHVIGGDFSFRFLDNHSLQGNYLFSITKSSDSEEAINANAISATYTFNTRPFYAQIIFEHMDPDFQIDSGFLLRNGLTRIQYLAGPNFYTNPDDKPWLVMISPVFTGWYSYDELNEQEDIYYDLSLRLYTIKQGIIRADYGIHTEAWAAQQFEREFFYFNAGAQLTNWLYLSTELSIGDKLFYDPVAPFLGYSFEFYGYIYLQPDNKLSQIITYNYESFKDRAGGDEIYDVNIFNLQTKYQFSENLFLRGILRYDSSQDIILTDLLASFTLIPGTVAHIGYGSLHNDLEWSDGRWNRNSEFSEFYQMRQSIFFKASYRWQM